MSPAPEYRRIEIRLPNDARAFPALEATIEHLGKRAGMSNARQRALARAVREACRAAFACRHDGSLGVKIEGFGDRVEVRVEYGGEGLRALKGRKTGALARVSRADRSRRGGPIRGPDRFKCSRVEREEANGVSLLVLVQDAKSRE